MNQIMFSTSKSAQRSDLVDSHGELKTSLKTLDGQSIFTVELEAFIEQTLEGAGVTGLSCAILNDAKLAYQKAFGYRNKNDGSLNDEQSIFAAASFSKTVFAYLVMLLVEEKVIDLDRPLYEYLDKPLYEYPAYADLKGDDRYLQITPRMVLGHTTGFPNLRFLMPDGKLGFLFPPGSRHSYSGEGMTLLQVIVEEVTGRDLEALAQEKIFQPLGMTRTSFIWQPEFEANHACPHDTYGRQRGWKMKLPKADGGGSMVTTASDYARLLASILHAKGIRKTTLDAMLESQIAINYRRMFGPEAWFETDEYQSIHLAWSLGWGRFDTPCGRAFFHTGHGPGWQNYTVTYLDAGSGIVLLSNSDNFESVIEAIAKKAIGDIYSPYDWLGYVPFDPSQEKKAPPPDPVAIEVDPTILAAYAGTYDMQPMATIKVKSEENKLIIQAPFGQGWVPLLAENETSLFIQGDEDWRVNFIRDDTGRATALQLAYRGLEFPLAKKVVEERAE